MSDSDSENLDPVTEVQPAVTPEAAKADEAKPAASDGVREAAAGAPQASAPSEAEKTETPEAKKEEANKEEPKKEEVTKDEAKKDDSKTGSVDNMRLPSLDDVKEWQGYRVDEVSGHSVARVEGVFVDQDTGKPAWVLLKLGRFGKVVPVSIRECAAAAGRVWVPHDREVIRDAPAIDPGMPLNKEQERIVLDYYGIPEDIGRGAEIAERKDGAITSQAPA